MRPVVIASSALTATLLGSLAVTPAGALPNVPIPKTKSIPVLVDMVGYITITHSVDSTSPCNIGFAYTMEENFTFETGKGVRTQLTKLQIPGQPAMTSAATSKPVGSAATSGRLSDWRTTNFCSSPAPEPVAPTCRTAKGKLTFGFRTALEGPAGESGLTPLEGRSLLLSLERRGGGDQDYSCTRARPPVEPVGTNYYEAMIDTSTRDRVTSVTLPTGIDSIKALGLKKGKSLRRTVTLTGPCDATRMNSRAGGTVSSTASCWVKGKVVISMKRPK